MALLDAPAIPRILLYDSRTGIYTANDHQGLTPADGFAGLSDPLAYHWTQPLDPAVAAGIFAHNTQDARSLRLACSDNMIQTGPTAQPQ
jgi:hypothetical protein